MKRIFCLFALTLAACAPTPKGDVVPAKQVLAENAGKQWECTNFDADGTCEGLSTRKIRGDRVQYDATFMLPKLPGLPGRARIDMRVDGQIEGTAICGNFDEARISVSGVPSSIATDLEQAFIAEIAKEGDICSRYYRDGPDSYVSVSTRRDGSKVKDGTARVNFFSKAPGLRSVSLF